MSEEKKKKKKKKNKTRLAILRNIFHMQKFFQLLIKAMKIMGRFKHVVSA